MVAAKAAGFVDENFGRRWRFIGAAVKKQQAVFEFFGNVSSNVPRWPTNGFVY